MKRCGLKRASYWRPVTIRCLGTAADRAKLYRLADFELVEDSVAFLICSNNLARKAAVRDEEIDNCQRRSGEEPREPDRK